MQIATKEIEIEETNEIIVWTQALESVNQISIIFSQRQAFR